MKMRKILSVLIPAVLIVLLIAGCGVPVRVATKTISVKELCKDDADVFEKTPVGLTYTKLGEEPEPGSVEVTSPEDSARILGSILDIKVYNLAEHVDMYVPSYEDYCFDFGDESYTFTFVPDSYICYGGAYYEIAESRLGSIRKIIETYKTGNADISELEFTFYDNGDEAPSYTEITLYSPDGELTAYLDGAYDILSVDREDDGYVVTYTYGDFYSHDTERSCRVRVENGELVIEELG